MAIPHAGPRFSRNRRPVAQRPDGGLGIRDRPPPVHTVTGEPFDGSGADPHPDRMFVHGADVSEGPAFARVFVPPCCGPTTLAPCGWCCW
jgi:hypothetical protein